MTDLDVHARRGPGAGDQVREAQSRDAGRQEYAERGDGSPRRTRAGPDQTHQQHRGHRDQHERERQSQQPFGAAAVVQAQGQSGGHDEHAGAGGPHCRRAHLPLPHAFRAGRAGQDRGHHQEGLELVDLEPAQVHPRQRLQEPPCVLRQQDQGQRADAQGDDRAHGYGPPARQDHQDQHGDHDEERPECDVPGHGGVVVGKEDRGEVGHAEQHALPLLVAFAGAHEQGRDELDRGERHGDDAGHRHAPDPPVVARAVEQPGHRPGQHAHGCADEPARVGADEDLPQQQSGQRQAPPALPEPQRGQDQEEPRQVDRRAMEVQELRVGEDVGCVELCDESQQRDVVVAPQAPYQDVHPEGAEGREYCRGDRGHRGAPRGDEVRRGPGRARTSRPGDCYRPGAPSRCRGPIPGVEDPPVVPPVVRSRTGSARSCRR